MIKLPKFNAQYGFKASAVTLLLLLCFCCASVYAATPAGTVIRNQASAVYTDDSGTQYTVTSNVVETVVEQVAGLELAQDQQQSSAAGSVVTFSHRLTNTGNGDDRYALQLVNESNDTIDLNSLAIFIDLDQNGVPDNDVPLTTTPWVSAGTDVYLVVSGVVPGNASAGDTAVVSLQASSQFTNTVVVGNSDTVNVDSGAIVTFTKSMSSSAGVSPSGSYTVTLNYANSGSAVANQVTLIDAIPAGMSYVSGSGQWNLTTQTLTDADPLDYHDGGNTRIQYCAYDASCINVPEAQTDQDTLTTNQVTAIIESLQPGESGFISFDINIEEQLSAGVLLNQAELQFDSGGATKPRIYSNGVSFTVLRNAAVVANGSQATAIDGMNEPVSVSSAPLSGTVSFENIIWNTGNAVDTFNMFVDVDNTSFPAGTVYQLLKADSATPLLDTNQDGAVDTGPVQPGSYAIVVLQLDLPFGVSGNNNGLGFDIRKIAQSSNDASVSNDIVDHLDEIVSNQVDLTNQRPAGSVGALGTGPGPEDLPVSTESADANGLVSFDLYIRHQGSFAGSYDLSAHSNPGGGGLLPGWKVEFIDVATGAAMTNTGQLSSGESKHVVARVGVPTDADFDTQSIFFKALSPLNGASDIKHDAVQNIKQAELNLTPSLSAQVNSGGSVVYEHLVTNSGNVALSDIAFLVQNSSVGWQSVLYADTDNNGFLSPDDLPLNGNMSLAAGESADVFLKVFAPAGSSQGQNNVSTLQAGSVIENLTSAVTDTTTVSESSVSIKKEQAVDVGCDGQPDPGNDFSPAHINVAPGKNCVIYKLTAINKGSTPSYNVVIRDYTPPYTVYSPAASCSRNPCWINEPDAEQTGTINAETDQLLPGDSYYLQFSVRVK